MSIHKNCDVCGGEIALDAQHPTITLPPGWLAAINEDVDSPPLDVCDTSCLVAAAATLGEVLGTDIPPVTGSSDELPQDEGDEHPLLPQASTRLDPDLQPRYFGPGDADGVTMRS